MLDFCVSKKSGNLYLCTILPLGSLSINDHDGYENEKVNPRRLKLDRAYFISPNSTNADNFFGVKF